jgi:hypothetical protein
MARADGAGLAEEIRQEGFNAPIGALVKLRLSGLHVSFGVCRGQAVYCHGIRRA